MSDRILIGETPWRVGQKVTIAGWVQTRRDHGKLVFIDIRDRSGLVQAVVIPDKAEAYEAAKTVRSEYVVELSGLVKERPGGTANARSMAGGVEIEVEQLAVISQPEEDLPVDVSSADLNVQLDTLLNYRTLTLRNEKVRSIFSLYAELLRAYADALRSDGFLEIKTPKIVSAATEGGANFFKIKYFDRDAYLAQSPQFYKQAGVSVFERVFEVGPVFRAEPHFTTRHVNEYISLDAEMGFIRGMEDVMDQLEKTIGRVMTELGERCQTTLARYGAAVPAVENIPRIKLADAVEILKKEFGKKLDEIDIDPEGERLICEWARREYNSDFIFLTRYPVAIRPFYAMPSADNPQETESFDLLFRGVEIATGGQRIHRYGQLVESIKKHGLNPDDFTHYLDIFRYGIPPHGGWGLGSERIIQQLLGLKSIKEAVLFPRDVKRIVP